MFGDRALAGLTRYRGGVAAAGLVVVLAVLSLLEPLELGLLERFFERRGPRPPTAPIVIISIDESSFAEMDQQWPFPRATHARLIRHVAAGRPLAIDPESWRKRADQNSTERRDGLSRAG